MDSSGETISSSLKNCEQLNFNLLLRKVVFSHNILRAHIVQLMCQGMIIKTEKTKNGPGRPVLVYWLLQR
jgi:hypothetical protein